MKKKVLSLILSFSLLIGIVSVNATSITFEDIDEDESLETIIEDNSEEIISEENLDITKSDSSKATEIDLDFIEENNEFIMIPEDITIPVKSIETFQELENDEEMISSSIKKTNKYTSLRAITEPIDITNLVTGPYANHTCVFNTKYNNTQHYEECIICGLQKNKVNHTLQLVGNDSTCDIYVNLGSYICSSNCGYSKPVPRLAHKRTGTPQWINHLSSISHMWFYCDVCGGDASNGLSELHTFNINGKIMDYIEMQKAGINLHALGRQTCTVCKLTYDFTYHYCYSDTCNICSKKIGPFMEYNISQNNMNNGMVMIDLVNNNSQYVYFTVDTKGFNYTTITATSLYGGNYTVKDPVLVSKNGNIWLYKMEVSLTNSNIPITEMLYINAIWRADVKNGTIINGYPLGSGMRGERTIPVYVSNKPPVISSIDSESITISNNWATSCEISVSGTAKKMSTVYVSMYYEDGTPIFEESACNVINDKFTFTSTPSFEANENDIFTFKVRDIFGNTTVTTKKLSNIDNIKPVMVNSQTEFTDGWSKSKTITIIAEDKGVGNVEIAFNNENDMKSTIQDGIQFSKTFDVIGDVYSSKKIAIYIKDALGNIETQYITIDKLDNTPPTITNITSKRQGTKNAIITVEANDINKTLNASGSGVAGYAITQEKVTPDISKFQKENTFNLTKSGIWYVYATDNAGNISTTPQSIDVKIEYTVSVDANGGVLGGDSTYKVISGETITIPNPTKEGYTFTGWTVSGEGTSINNNKLTMGSEDTTITANYKVNKYTVTYIDRTPDGKEIGRVTKEVDYGTVVSGSDIGSLTNDNSYHNQYRYVSDTTATVTTNGATVYRIFEFCETEATSNLQWNDNNNEDGLRPDKYKVKLKQNGKVIDEVELSSSTTNHTFSNLPKYDSDGNPYQYEFETIVSDRYKTSFDEGNQIVENYEKSNFSVIIPKKIILDGNTGKAEYHILINGTLYYNDILTIEPEENFTLSDRSNISSMEGNVTQFKTTVMKEDLNSSIDGKIQTDRKLFSGKWQGSFNFNIHFEMKN